MSRRYFVYLRSFDAVPLSEVVRGEIFSLDPRSVEGDCPEAMDEPQTLYLATSDGRLQDPDFCDGEIEAECVGQIKTPSDFDKLRKELFQKW